MATHSQFVPPPQCLQAGDFPETKNKCQYHSCWCNNMAVSKIKPG